MKVGKAAEPSGVTAKQLKNLDEDGIEWLRDLMRKIVQDGEIPDD